MNGDCSTGRCDLTTKLCRALTASESCTAADNTNSPIQNFWETDVYCGGPDCTSCGETAPNKRLRGEHGLHQRAVREPRLHLLL